MKLWLLDADIIIDFLSLGIFDKLVEAHEIYVADTVVDQVQYFKKGEEKVRLDFREVYVSAGRVRELRASWKEIQEILSQLPPPKREAIHAGELESLAVLAREETLTFCTCDAFTIRALPFLDLGGRGISAERLLRSSGLMKPGTKDRHSEIYFKSNLAIGQRERIEGFRTKRK